MTQSIFSNIPCAILCNYVGNYVGIVTFMVACDCVSKHILNKYIHCGDSL